jgi:hypothetical protein
MSMTGVRQGPRRRDEEEVSLRFLLEKLQNLDAASSIVQVSEWCGRRWIHAWHHLAWVNGAISIRTCPLQSCSTLLPRAMDAKTRIPTMSW